MSKRKNSAVSERYTKSQILAEIAENTELSKKDVKAVFDELENVIERHVKKRSCGEFVLPGIMKIVTKKKPATKEREGVNPFTGEKITIPAKKASMTVRARPLKKLKEMALA